MKLLLFLVSVVGGAALFYTVLVVASNVQGRQDENFRWPLALAGLAVYALLWVPAVLLRRRLDLERASVCPSFPPVWLVIAVMVEYARLFCNFGLDPWFLVRTTNQVLVFVHLTGACSLLVYALSLRVLRVPMNGVVAAATVGIAGLGAWVDLMIASSASAAV